MVLVPQNKEVSWIPHLTEDVMIDYIKNSTFYPYKIVRFNVGRRKNLQDWSHQKRGQNVKILEVILLMRFIMVWVFDKVRTISTSFCIMFIDFNDLVTPRFEQDKRNVAYYLIKRYSSRSNNCHSFVYEQYNFRYFYTHAFITERITDISSQKQTY